MSNIIASDMYRLRKGAALRNTVIGLFVTLLFITVMLMISQTEGFATVVAGGAEGMTAAEVAELQQDMIDSQQQVDSIGTAAAYGSEMLGQSFVPLFFLPIAIAVFCADFSAGTYRNLLSYEPNRNRVYLAKLSLSVGISLCLVLFMLVVSWIFGTVMFGFTGFTAAYFIELLVTLLLQLPLYLGFVGVAHCLIAFTKKSSSTIAIFLIGAIGIAIVLQILASTFPSLSWLAIFDPLSAGKLVANRAMLETWQAAAVVGYHGAVAVVATLLGMIYYKRTDMP